MSKPKPTFKCLSGECPKNRCPYVLTVGANKGLCCSERAYPTQTFTDGTKYCRKHSNKLTVGKIRPNKKAIEQELNEEINPKSRLMSKRKHKEYLI